MTEVTREAFFAALNADKRDIMPQIVGGYDQNAGYTSEWSCQKTRAVFGKSIGNETGAKWFLQLPNGQA